MLIKSLTRHLKSTYRASALPFKRQDSEEDAEIEADEESENIVEPCRAPAYPYRKLGETEVRLLRIVPGTGVIECLLHQMPLAEVDCFFALSYVWGDPTQKEIIMLEGQPFQITRNLYEALYQFRQRTSGIGYPRDYFWIDSICINQCDNVEKSREISRMMEIYHAGLVSVWLGPIEKRPEGSLLQRVIRHAYFSGTPMSREEAIKILFDKATSMWVDWDPVDDDDEVVVDSEFGDAYVPVMEAMLWLLTRPWFTRVWTIQEACLDAVPRYYAGRYSVAGQDLYDIFNILAIQYHSLYLTPGARRIVTTKLLRRLDMGVKTGKDRGLDNVNVAEVLWELLKSTSKKEATDPRDQIYGILSLLGHITDRELPEELIPNYDLEYQRVYWDYAAFLFQSLGSLELLGCKGNKLQGVPSWVPDFRSLHLGSTRSRGQSVHVSPDKRVLHVRGCVVGTFRNCVDGVDLSRVMPKVRAIPPELPARLNLVEERILQPSADIRGVSVEEVFPEIIGGATRLIDEDGIESFYEVYRRLARSPGGKRSWYARRRRTINIRLKEELIADQFRSSFLLLADGTILRLTEEGVEAKTSDLVCVFQGASNPGLVRSSGGQYIFISRCEVKGGPLKQTFDDDFWASMDVQDFQLI